MSYGADRERWFTFRSERLRTFMEAWLSAHAMRATPRPQWSDELGPESDVAPDSVASSPEIEGPEVGQRPAQAQRRGGAGQIWKALIELLGPRDLDALAAFGDAPQGASSRTRLRPPP